MPTTSKKHWNDNSRWTIAKFMHQKVLQATRVVIGAICSLLWVWWILHIRQPILVIYPLLCCGKLGEDSYFDFPWSCFGRIQKWQSNKSDDGNIDHRSKRCECVSRHLVWCHEINSSWLCTLLHRSALYGTLDKHVSANPYQCFLWWSTLKIYHKPCMLISHIPLNCIWNSQNWLRVWMTNP